MEKLRPLVDRVLNLKKEQDDLTKDIREVYAEAKASGIDKTVMGQVVAHLRKRDKDPVGIKENGELFETYLAKYDGSESTTYKNTRAHEDQPAHDPSTGELIDEPEAAQAVEGEAAPASGDAVEMPPQFPARLAADASPTIPQPAAGLPSAAALAVQPVTASPDDGAPAGAPLPAFLERGNPACVVGRMQ